MEWDDIWVFADSPDISMVRAKSREEASKKFNRLPQCITKLKDFVKIQLMEEHPDEEGALYCPDCGEKMHMKIVGECFADPPHWYTTYDCDCGKCWIARLINDLMIVEEANST